MKICGFGIRTVPDSVSQLTRTLRGLGALIFYEKKLLHKWKYLYWIKTTLFKLSKVSKWFRKWIFWGVYIYISVIAKKNMVNSTVKSVWEVEVAPRNSYCQRLFWMDLGIKKEKIYFIFHHLKRIHDHLRPAAYLV